MFNLFKKDPVEKLNQEYAKILEQAMNAQRNGNIELYSELSQKAEEIGKKIDELKSTNNIS